MKGTGSIYLMPVVEAIPDIFTYLEDDFGLFVRKIENFIS